MRARMNSAHGASGAYIGGSGTVPNVEGTGQANPYRQGRNLSVGPTTGFLLLMVVVEVAALVVLRRVFKNAHGG